MKRPNFQEKTEVKIISHDFSEYCRADGVERNTNMYGWRGKVVAVRGFDKHLRELEKPYSPDNYPEIWWVDAEFASPVDGSVGVTTFEDWENQLAPVQKKFITPKRKAYSSIC